MRFLCCLALALDSPAKSVMERGHGNTDALAVGQVIAILAMLPAVHFGFRATDQDPLRAWAALLGNIVVTFLAWIVMGAATLGIAFVLHRHAGLRKGDALQVGVGAACLFVAIFQPRAIMYFNEPTPRDSWWQPVQLAAVLAVVGGVLLIAGLLNLTPLPI